MDFAAQSGKNERTNYVSLSIVIVVQF